MYVSYILCVSFPHGLHMHSHAHQTSAMMAIIAIIIIYVAAYKRVSMHLLTHVRVRAHSIDLGKSKHTRQSVHACTCKRMSARPPACPPSHPLASRHAGAQERRQARGHATTPQARSHTSRRQTKAGAVLHGPGQARARAQAPPPPPATVGGCGATLAVDSA